MAYRGPNTTTSTSGKKVQTRPNNQNTLLVKNYLEQELEAQGNKGRVMYDATNKSLIQFRVKEGTIAVLKEGKICIFKMPMKKFKGSMPLEFQTVDTSSIKTQKATCCKKCHCWKQQADINRCVCGGYLVPRKRFSAVIVESWDEEFLEIEFARKDIRAAMKINGRPRKQRPYISTGITPKLAWVSSIIPEKTPHMELLLIPKGDDLKKIPVRSVESCSMVFVAAIVSQGKQYTDTQKTEILAECAKEQQDDKVFASEMRQFIRNTTPNTAQSMIYSWNNNSIKPQRRQSTSKGETRSLRKQGNQSTPHIKTGKGLQKYASSIPVPKEHQRRAN